MKFNKKMLQEIVYDDCETASKVVDTINDTTRWSVLHTMVFSYKGKFYTSGYSTGATEQQDERPYEYSVNDVECPEVELKEIVIMDWVIKK